MEAQQDPNKRVVRNLSEEIARPFDLDLNTSWRDSDRAQQTSPESNLDRETVVTKDTALEQRNEQQRVSNEVTPSAEPSSKSVWDIISSNTTLGVIWTTCGVLNLASGHPVLASLNAVTAGLFFFSAYMDRK